jgi:hypothetical protein
MSMAPNASCWRLSRPRQRLAPPSRRVCSMITGLSQGRLEGETASRACRPMKATRAALSGVMPRIGRVALRHHSSWARNACCQKTKGTLSQALSSNRRSPLAGTKGLASAVPLVAELSAKRARRAAAFRARSESSICRPGARARCEAHSNQAANSACGEMPWVKRAKVARASRSIVSKDGPSGGGEARSSPGLAGVAYWPGRAGVRGL